MILAPRPAFALFSTLVAILLLSALSTATFFRATTDAHIAYTTTLRQHAFFTAERALWSAVTNDPDSLKSLPLYHTLISTTSTSTQTTRTTTTKGDTALYWITTQSTIHRGQHQATHRLGISVRLTLSPDSTPTLTPIPPYAWLTLP